ncbi:hypothetical protein EYF80_021041 [Liparis tanakae]|uniref:Uncharacterized protein n=1 Tax=Liparis tanakae TaxID=230148 RepID=A0A4Z2HSA9_9TELE|nr:hypothetical protein EYF80_021041 [Liparis tanakae]
MQICGRMYPEPITVDMDQSSREEALITPLPPDYPPPLALPYPNSPRPHQTLNVSGPGSIDPPDSVSLGARPPLMRPSGSCRGKVKGHKVTPVVGSGSKCPGLRQSTDTYSSRTQ